MTSSKKVLVTSSVLFAFVDRNHPKHRQASAFLRYFAQDKFQVFVPLSEINLTYSQLKKHVSYGIAKDFLRTVFVGDLEILYSDEATAKTALKLALTPGQGDVSFSQVLINVLADKNQIPQICTLDFLKTYFGISIFNLPY